MESNRSQTSEFSNHDPAIKSGEILSSASALEIAKQSAQTKISDRTVFESGHREKPVGTEGNSKVNSELERSTDEKLIEIEVSFSQPKLNLAPEREKKESRFNEKDRSSERNR